MKYSLRKSFSCRRRKENHDDDHVNPRTTEPNGGSNSNSNLVKSNQSKSFLRRRRRYSSSPPPASSPTRTKSKTSELPYNNHINDDEDDDADNDPFALSPNINTPARPLNKLADQIRKSFRGTLTRRSRLESTNSNKRLILNTNDENRPMPVILSPITTGLTSPMILPAEPIFTDEKDKLKTPKKRRKAPLAPTHMNHSISVPNENLSTLSVTENSESGYVSSSNDQQQQQQQNISTKKIKFNRSFRQQISLLFKKRHAKQQQQQLQIQNCIDEDLDHQQHFDDQDEINMKKLTLGQRFDTLRRSLHIGNRNSMSKGKGYLLSNE
ncbi:unnamed protein product [Adineta steineri]|uniref:Uncharacterized protein n=1 Tax=Adineta steineri TaxID=433720 RepID=A0A813SI58_9BILA|nr:unnamed protein product [Adineta steineri]